MDAHNYSRISMARILMAYHLCWLELLSLSLQVILCIILPGWLELPLHYFSWSQACSSHISSTVVCWYPYHQNTTFQLRGNHVLKGATIKGKHMLPMGSIFFPLKAAPMRIDNTFKRHYIEKPPKFNYSNMPVLRSPNFDAVNTK